jgi:predicted ArsR family transcriptional regulator
MVGWTFLTNHAQVLLCIAINQRATAKEMAQVVGVTERAVQRIIDNLEAEGYISRFRDGRKNRYEIHREQPLRHPAQAGRTVGALLAALVDGE